MYLSYTATLRFSFSSMTGKMASPCPLLWRTGPTLARKFLRLLPQKQGLRRLQDRRDLTPKGSRSSHTIHHANTLIHCVIMIILSRICVAIVFTSVIITIDTDIIYYYFYYYYYYTTTTTTAATTTTTTTAAAAAATTTTKLFLNILLVIFVLLQTSRLLEDQ